MVEKHDIMFKILHKLHPMHQSEALKTVTSSPIFYQRFFKWPRNYYNNNKMSFSSECSLSGIRSFKNIGFLEVFTGKHMFQKISLKLSPVCSNLISIHTTGKRKKKPLIELQVQKYH